MEKKVIRQRLCRMRSAMREAGIDYYIVPTADFHNSEYVSDYFKTREFLSGFTGSNGTLVISQDEAGLWTDGRYFVQAEQELTETGIRLFRMQEEGVPDIPTYLQQNMWEGQSLGFDGRVVDACFGQRLEKALSDKKLRFVYEKDLVDGIWQERPAFPCSRAETVPLQYCGETVSEKLERVREKMREAKASCFFLSKLDDLMWLFNLRGSDVECNPVLMSYGFITEEGACIFLQAGALQKEAVDSMREAGVRIRDYHTLLSFLKSYLFKQNHTAEKRGFLLYDRRNISYTLYRLFDEYGSCREQQNPTEALKAVKTEKELEYIRSIYLKDSVAVTKFIYWLKQTAAAGSPDREKLPEAQARQPEEPEQTAQAQQPEASKLPEAQARQPEESEQTAQARQPEEGLLTEYSAAQHLDDLRRNIPECLGLSFPTISAYMENAAMMHYEADRVHCSSLRPEGMLLVDSGGQYLGGTTDVTRTIVLGPVSQEIREHFTAVAVGMLRLADARFLYGCTGRNLDILARSPLWDLGIDYKCGTGHGIGYMLNVHEGPHSIRWRYVEGLPEAVLEEGMLVSDEPGVYRKDLYGIRTENVLEIRKGAKTPDGQFMQFAHLTYVPIDLEAILPEQMPEKERKALNAYHRSVYEKLAPYMTEEEQNWLAQATRAV